MRLRILVVDDSAVAVAKLSVALEGLGHEVVASVNSGAAALESYRATAPDLVTMDISMPGMCGVEAVRQIYGAFPQARVLMVTSQGQERLVVEALAAGASGYVLKPVRPEKLAEVIHKVLSRPATASD